MLLLIPVLVLLLALAAMYAVRSVRRGYAYQWLIAVVSLMGVVAYLLFLRGRMPIMAQFSPWQPEALFPIQPALLLDQLSWLFALAVVTIALAVLLTAVARLVVGNWLPWAGTLALAAISLLAVMAGGPLMLLLAWAALDVVDLWIVLVQVQSSAGREQAVVSLSARIAGMGFLIWAMLLASSGGQSLNFASIPANASLYLLLAGGLRLGVIPLQAPVLGQLPARRGLGTSLRLLPTASSLVLLVRAASASVPTDRMGFLLVLTGIAALYSALSWMLAQDAVEARPFWILALAALAVSSALKGDAQATQSWGLALLLGGSYLFLLAPNHPRLVFLGFLVVLGISGLPFSLTWAGLGMYATTLTGFAGALTWSANLLLFLSHICILLGFIKYILRTPADSPPLERWMWLVYPLGLCLLVFASLSLGWNNRLDLQNVPWVGWGAGLLTLGAAVGVWWWGKRNAERPHVQASIRRGTDWSTTLWAHLLSMQWFYRVVGFLYKSLRRLLRGFTRVLEGDGGLLWAFVLLGLLWSLFLG